MVEDRKIWRSKLSDKKHPNNYMKTVLRILEDIKQNLKLKKSI